MSVPTATSTFPAIGANEIWRVKLEGGKPEVFATNMAVPTAVKFDSKGSLLSTQGASGEILRFDIRAANAAWSRRCARESTTSR